ncbi:MAG: LytTR family transcriptional regulator [Bacteroidetes bacterium]|nr:LytTR family transcriptional regulator [Bacteroidota bacterium]
MTTSLPLPHLQYNHHLPFPVQDVIRLDGKRNYTIFSLTDGTQFTSSRTLGFYENAFPKSFLRLHKSCMINLRFLESLNETERTAQLTNGTVVVIARRRWPFIKDYFSD